MSKPANTEPDNSVKNNIIELSFKPTETNIGNVLTELNNSNYNIQDISTQETKLEDLFLQLTNG